MAELPDIILFLTDDHAKWAAGPYGDPHVLTPNLDYMAAEGIVMENAYTPTPVCSPARACLFTGRYASQHGVHDYLGNHPDRDVNKYWMKDERILPELFREKGYETALIGKWHLGQEHTEKDHFDYSFTLGTEYPILHGKKRTFYRGGTPVECTGSLTRAITDDALNYLKNIRKDKPLFLVIGHYATHSPWTDHPERLVDFYRKKGLDSRDKGAHYPFGFQRNESVDPTRNDPAEALCQYYAAVTQIDESLGAVMDQVEGSDRKDETLMIYTSDHGLNCGDHGLWGKGNATYPLNMLDSSLQVPLIFYGPELLFSKQRRKERVDHTDLFQTVLELGGIRESEEERADRNSPGLSFASLLRNDRIETERREEQYGEYGPVRMVRTEDYKLVLFPEKERNLLFDLNRDPQETVNLYARAEYARIRDELSGRITEHFGKYTSETFDGLKMTSELPRYNIREAWYA